MIPLPLASHRKEIHMNDRCHIAQQFPCAFAPDTLHARFWRRLCIDGRWLSSIVTVNK